MTELITKIDWDCLEVLGEISLIKDEIDSTHPCYERLDKTEDRLIQIGDDLALLREKTMEQD